MTVTLDATVGGASANSYIDVATADALLPFLVTVARFDAWKKNSVDEKATYLIRAVKLIETYVDFDGMRLVQDQPLDWPRYYVYGPDRQMFPYDANSIPPPVRDAQALMAVNLGEGFDQEVAAASPLRHLQISTLKLDFETNKSARGAMLLPAEVVEKLRGFGEYAGASGLARSIGVMRA